MECIHVILIITGLLAGVLSGMFGIGGGAVMVPALVSFASFGIREANGTSLSALMLPVGIFAAAAFYRQGLIRIKPALMITLGLFTGVFFGAKIALSIPEWLLKTIYAVFLLYMSSRYLELPKLLKRFMGKGSSEGQKEVCKPQEELEKSALFPLYFLLGLGSGVLSGMFGIGGGAVIVTVLVFAFGFPQRSAVASSLGALLMPVALPGVISYYNAGEVNVFYAALLAGGLLAGAFFGAAITIRTPEKLAKRIYAIFLFAVAVRFIVF